MKFFKINLSRFSLEKKGMENTHGARNKEVREYNVAVSSCILLIPVYPAGFSQCNDGRYHGNFPA
jgi:hypothetical protein